jgi:hypothetical protein
MATGSDWQRLGELVSERRADLGLTQEDLRAAGGPSTATQRLIEGGRQDRYQPSILAREERALQWERGSVRRILAGGDPTPASPAAKGLRLPALILPPDCEDDTDVTDAVVLAALPPRERRVWAEVHAHPEGTPAAVIFPGDVIEQLLWGRDAPEAQKIREIAALRSVHARPSRERRAG